MRQARYIVAAWAAAWLLSGCNTGTNPEWWKPQPRAAQGPAQGPAKTPGASEEALRKQLQQLTTEKAVNEEALNKEIRTLKGRVADLELLNRSKSEDLRMQEQELRQAKSYQGQAEVYKRQADLLQQKVANLEAILNQLQKAPGSRPAAGK